MNSPYPLKKGNERRPIRLSWNQPAADEGLRHSGLKLVGDVPWGTHFCLFYETLEDLIDSNLAYFKAGLEARECGLWILPHPLGLDQARTAFSKGLADMDGYVESGCLQICTAQEWYLQNGTFDLEKTFQAVQRKTYQALAQGYTGLRLSATSLWQTLRLWKDFAEYERVLDGFIAGNRILAMCTYSLTESPASDIFEVAKAHQIALVIRHGEWRFFEVPQLEDTKRELRTLNADLDVLSDFKGRDLLTAREKVVLGQIMKGDSTKVVAKTLGISPRTVEFHRANIMQKLGVGNLMELARLVLGR